MAPVKAGLTADTRLHPSIHSTLFTVHYSEWLTFDDLMSSTLTTRPSPCLHTHTHTNGVLLQFTFVPLALKWFLIFTDLSKWNYSVWIWGPRCKPGPNRPGQISAESHWFSRHITQQRSKPKVGHRAEPLQPAVTLMSPSMTLHHSGHSSPSPEPQRCKYSLVARLHWNVFY